MSEKRDNETVDEWIARIIERKPTKADSRNAVRSELYTAYCAAYRTLVDAGIIAEHEANWPLPLPLQISAAERKELQLLEETVRSSHVMAKLNRNEALLDLAAGILLSTERTHLSIEDGDSWGAAHHMMTLQEWLTDRRLLMEFNCEPIDFYSGKVEKDATTNRKRVRSLNTKYEIQRADDRQIYLEDCLLGAPNKTAALLSFAEHVGISGKHPAQAARNRLNAAFPEGIPNPK